MSVDFFLLGFVPKALLVRGFKTQGLIIFQSPHAYSAVFFWGYFLPNGWYGAIFWICAECRLII